MKGVGSLLCTVLLMGIVTQSESTYVSRAKCDSICRNDPTTSTRRVLFYRHKRSLTSWFGRSPRLQGYHDRIHMNPTKAACLRLFPDLRSCADTTQNLRPHSHGFNSWKPYIPIRKIHFWRRRPSPTQKPLIRKPFPTWKPIIRIPSPTWKRWFRKPCTRKPVATRRPWTRKPVATRRPWTRKPVATRRPWTRTSNTATTNLPTTSTPTTTTTKASTRRPTTRTTTTTTTTKPTTSATTPTTTTTKPTTTTMRPTLPRKPPS